MSWSPARSGRVTIFLARVSKRRYGWTDEEIRVLHEGIATGESHRVIGERLGRKRTAVSYMAATLGYGKPIKERTSDDLRALLLSRRDVKLFGCWEWTGHRDPDGYGRVGLGYFPKLTHRLSYELFVGPIPEAKAVMHRCDNPPCFNPGHLRLGTAIDNNREKTERDRDAKGEQHGMVRYSADQIEEIKRRLELGEGQTEIANAMGVNRATVHKIATGKQWREVVRR